LSEPHNQDELADLRECHAWLLRRVAEARDSMFKKAMRKRAKAVEDAIKRLEKL
jgi:hypothetical protein